MKKNGKYPIISELYVTFVGDTLKMSRTRSPQNIPEQRQKCRR